LDIFCLRSPSTCLAQSSTLSLSKQPPFAPFFHYPVVPQFLLSFVAALIINIVTPPRPFWSLSPGLAPAVPLLRDCSAPDSAAPVPPSLLTSALISSPEERNPRHLDHNYRYFVSRDNHISGHHCGILGLRLHAPALTPLLNTTIRISASPRDVEVANSPRHVTTQWHLLPNSPRRSPNAASPPSLSKSRSNLPRLHGGNRRRQLLLPSSLKAQKQCGTPRRR